ncbi:MAG: formate transporter FocA [Chloroflexota bacterium]
MAQLKNFSIDALLPKEMAEKAEETGIVKANYGPRRLIVLGILAGAFIGLGAIFATTVSTGSSELPYGVGKLLSGLVFSLGLILVIVGGAELFTGNNLIVMAWASKKISTKKLLRNWIYVYIGNFIGSIGTALLLFYSGQYTFAGGAVGLTALNIANEKTSLGFIEAISLGILCNALVCLAVWLAMSARTTTDKIMAVIFPITAFVAAGFEHSIANMYFISIGQLIKSGAPDSFWTTINKVPSEFAAISWKNMVIINLVPVTLGNIIGGTLLVGAVYWTLYLRKSS